MTAGLLIGHVCGMTYTCCGCRFSVQRWQLECRWVSFWTRHESTCWISKLFTQLLFISFQIWLLCIT